MPYIVRAATKAGDGNWEFDVALDAVKKATELLANGVTDLTVKAPNGRAYRDVEFAQMLTQAEATDAHHT